MIRGWTERHEVKGDSIFWWGTSDRSPLKSVTYKKGGALVNSDVSRGPWYKWKGTLTYFDISGSVVLRQMVLFYGTVG